MVMSQCSHMESGSACLSDGSELGDVTRRKSNCPRRRESFVAGKGTVYTLGRCVSGRNIELSP